MITFAGFCLARFEKNQFHCEAEFSTQRKRPLEITENIWHFHSLSTDRFFKVRQIRVSEKYIHFKTQPGLAR